jgi:hypothetical protein
LFIILRLNRLFDKAYGLQLVQKSNSIPIFISCFGISVGTGIIIGFLNPFVLLSLTGTSLPALSMLLYSPRKQRKLIAKYRQSEESLIKP